MFMAKLLGAFVVVFLYMICIFIGWTIASNVQSEASCRKTDMDALLSLKNGFQDPRNMLWLWNGSNCCEWPGIGCDSRSLSVTSVDLSGYGLSGDISSSLTKLESLTYLDLSLNSFNDSTIPEFFGSLSKLRYLNLSRAGFGGILTPRLGNLSNLEYLDLSASYNSSNLAVASLQWLILGCRYLKHLAFDSVMSKAGSNWLEDINKLSQLDALRISNCRLTGSVSSLSIVNRTLTSLIEFSTNNFQGGIPSSFGMLCNLRMLDVSYNNLTESLPEYLSSCSFGSPLPNLRYLHLNSNKLKGNLPAWLGHFGNLKELWLNNNAFQGSIPRSFGALTKLQVLNLSENKLNGTVYGTIGKLSELKLLGLSSNQLSFKVGSNWVPSFQLYYLGLRSCQLDSTIPTWLKSQKQLSLLDLSNSNMSGNVPSWFWDDIAPNLSWLNISFNHLQGQLPNPLPSFEFAYIDLSSNLFNGPIPIPTGKIRSFILSNNRFTGTIPVNIGEKQPQMVYLSLSNNVLSGEIPTSIGLMSQLCLLDLSSNTLSGTIPSNISNFAYLLILDLSNNNLSGSIPSTVWNSSLLSMYLNNNRLSGSLPTYNQNQSYLVILDLSHNYLSGAIPSWLGQGFMNLRVLNLRSNNFNGVIPPTLSNLSLLHVLDLAENKLTGNIPSTFSHLLGMSQSPSTGWRFDNESYQFHHESQIIITKSIIQKYTKTLYLLRSIDLSCNRFSGPFPDGITNLSSLKFLNLSRNEIHGRIPESISKMRALESLDFSNNKLFGAISTSILSLTFLGAFNVSNNNLIGKIPMSPQFSTFNQSAFEGNPRLCGSPLTVLCPGGDGGVSSNQGDETVVEDDENGYTYLSLGVGFGVGLLIPVLGITAKESWRLQYLKFVDMIVDYLTCKFIE